MSDRKITVPESALRELASLFSEIRNDWTDPRSECRAGWAIIDTLLQLPDAEVEAEAAALRVCRPEVSPCNCLAAKGHGNG